MNPVIEVYQRQGKSKKWSWRLVASNTQIVATPQKGFQGLGDAKSHAQECKASFPKTTLENIKVKGQGRAWRWVVRLQGRYAVYPHQSFTSERGAYRSIRRVNRLFREAKIKVIG